MATDDMDTLKREFALLVDALGVDVNAYYVKGKAIPPDTEQTRYCWREVGSTVKDVVELPNGLQTMMNLLDKLFAERPPQVRARIRGLVGFWASGTVRSKRDVKAAWRDYIEEHGLDRDSAEAAALYGLGMAFVSD